MKGDGIINLEIPFYFFNIKSTGYNGTQIKKIVRKTCYVFNINHNSKACFYLLL